MVCPLIMNTKQVNGMETSREHGRDITEYTCAYSRICSIIFTNSHLCIRYGLRGMLDYAEEI